MFSLRTLRFAHYALSAALLTVLAPVAYGQSSSPANRFERTPECGCRVALLEQSTVVHRPQTRVMRLPECTIVCSKKALGRIHSPTTELPHDPSSVGSSPCRSLCHQDWEPC